MAQDLTTYTEVDPATDLTVTTSRVTASTLARNVDAYLYRDFGTNYFAADFTVYADFSITTGNSGAGIVPIIAFTNTLNDLKGIRDALGDELHCTLFNNGALYQIYIGVSDSIGILTDSIDISLNTIYYIKFYRDESVGTYGTLYLKLYTSSANRDSDTGAITRSITLRSNIDFRYFLAMQSYNDGTTAYLNGYVENIDKIDPLRIAVSPLTGAFSIPAPILEFPTFVTPSSLTGAFTLPAPTIVSSIKVLPDPLTATFFIPTHVAGLGIVAVDPLTATFTMPAVTVTLPAIVTVNPLTGTFYILDPYVVASQKSILFGAYNFPNGKTMSYKIVDDTEAIIQDWTTTGVVETVVDATANKSIYSVRTNKINENFQGKIMWKTSDATPLTAVEIINIYSSYVDILQNRVTAQRATNLDDIPTRLAAADYTAPDNAGIAALPTLAEMLAGGVAKESTLATAQADITSVLNYAIAMSKWKNNKLARTVAGTTETWVLYDDDSTTPLLTWTNNISTRVRTKAT